MTRHLRAFYSKLYLLLNMHFIRLTVARKLFCLPTPALLNAQDIYFFPVVVPVPYF